MTARFAFTDRARPIVEIGLGSSTVPTGQALWDVALWDASTSKWAGTEPVWAEVTCEGISAHIDAGRARVADLFAVARCEITFNNVTGWADPYATVGTTLTMRPGRAIRVGMVHATLGTVWRFRGFIDSVDAVYEAEEDDSVILRCIDALGEAGRAKVADMAVTGAGEAASTRFGRVLDAVPWLTDKRSVDSNLTPLVPFSMAGQVVDMLQQTARSGGGFAFGDTEGNVAMRGKGWLYYDETEPVDGVIGNVSGDGAAVSALLLESASIILLEDVASHLMLEESAGGQAVCPTAWRRPMDRASMTTRVILGQAAAEGSTPIGPFTYDDTAAQVIYGVEPFEVLDLWTRDKVDMDSIAYRLLSTRSAATMPRIEWVELEGNTGDDVVDLLTTCTPFTPSRYRCVLVEARGDVFDETCFVVGISEDIGVDSWTARVSLDRSALFAVLGPGEWDDGAYWDRSLWN